jgi:hypothetical protein
VVGSYITLADNYREVAQIFKTDWH